MSKSAGVTMSGNVNNNNNNNNNNNLIMSRYKWMENK